MIILKNILGIITDPKNTRMFLLGGIVVLCILLLRQCQATDEAKGEASRIENNWKASLDTIQNYIDEIVSSKQDTGPIPGWSGTESGSSDEQDELYDEAVNFVIESRRASISAVQRKLRIGYNRAARLIETMEEAGLVSEMSSNGSREVLVPKR